MRAVRFHDTDGLAGVRLEEVGKPEPQAGELLVRVAAASINPFDFYAVCGYVNAYVRFKLPAILGRDFSGVVAAMGPGVTRFAVGDPVFGYVAADANGTFAEYVAVPAAQAAPKPDGCSHVEAASLPNVLMAAWDGLFSTSSGMDLRAGQTVLVNGAAGGIGSVAVQLAAWRGARVIGTASTGNLQLVRQLGADAFDYAEADWTSSLSDVNGVLDTADGSCADSLCGLIGKGGHFIALRGLPQDGFAERWAARGIVCRVASGPASAPSFAAMAEVVASGAVRPVVTATYPLEAFRTPLEAAGHGHARGKSVLTIDPAALDGDSG